MSKATILIIEDEEDIQQLVSYNLLKQEFHVLCADDGENGLLQAGGKNPDLILLDIMLPGINGLEVLTRLKSTLETRNIPVILLSARGEEEDIVNGLERGADDYVPKPFSPKILIARIESVLRRRQPEKKPDISSSLSLHGLHIDQDRRQLDFKGQDIRTTVSEFDILTVLMKRPGWVFTRQQIIDHIHGQDFLVTERLVDVQIHGLRKKLGKAGELIETIRGIGYRFRE